jgi:hypothetical protein
MADKLPNVVTNQKLFFAVLAERIRPGAVNRLKELANPLSANASLGKIRRPRTGLFR